MTKGTKFIDPANPTVDEIRQWASRRAEKFPIQDWDLMITVDSAKFPLFLELAGNQECPKRKTFLRVLYLVVGDGVRSKWHAHDRARVEALILQGEVHANPVIRLWASRARTLIAAPESFNHAAWIRGDLARDR